MIATLLRTAVWIGLIDALAGAAVLGFLYTPESNALMLGASAVLVLAAIVLLMFSSGSAAHALVHKQAPWRSARPTLRSLPLVLLVVVIVGVLCGAAGWFEAWWTSKAGEVDAAAIVTGDVTHTQPLHTAVRWFVAFVQWVVVPAWVATGLTWIAGFERRDVLGLKWLGAGLHWRMLLVTLAAVAIGVWLPWRALYWRPRGLPPSGLELAFAAVKVGTIYFLSQVAWAVTLWTAAARVVPSGQAIHVVSGTATLPADRT